MIGTALLFWIASVLISDAAATFANCDVASLLERRRFRHDLGVSLDAMRNRESGYGRQPRFRNLDAFVSAYPKPLKACAQHNFFIESIIDELLPNTDLDDVRDAILSYAMFNNTDAVRYLAEQTNFCSAWNNQLECDQVILEAIKCGYDSVVVTLYEMRASIVPRPLPVALSEAIRYNRINILRLLEQRGFCSRSDYIESDFTSPLSEAIRLKHYEMVQFMLERIRDLDFDRYRFYKRAVENDNATIIHLLETEWQTPLQDRLDAHLFRTIMQEHESNVPELLKSGANPARDNVLAFCFFLRNPPCSFNTALALAQHSNSVQFFNNIAAGAYDICPPVWPHAYLTRSDFKKLFDAITSSIGFDDDVIECFLRIYLTPLTETIRTNIRNNVIPQFEFTTEKLKLVQFWDGLQANDLSQVVANLDPFTVSFTVNSQYPIDVAFRQKYYGISKALIKEGSPIMHEFRSRFNQEQWRFFGELLASESDSDFEE